MTDRPIHIIPHVPVAPPLTARWDDQPWRDLTPVEISHVHHQSSDHHPHTRAKLCYDAADLYVLFLVDDRYVVSRHTAPGSAVYEDSCVEAFLQPGDGTGYINFEMNAGGTILASHITDPKRIRGGFAAFRLIPPEKLQQVQISSTLPRIVLPEIAAPTQWQLSARLPFSLITEFTSAPPPGPGTLWRGNFFKCADKSSHPHWASWSPVAEELNFHRPDCFGTLRFA
jgi:hypothetical protein